MSYVQSGLRPLSTIAAGEFETDISGTITAGGTAQDISAAHTRYSYSIQNNDLLYSLYVSTTGTATTASYVIPPGYVFTNDSKTTTAISLYSDLTGHVFTATEMT